VSDIQFTRLLSESHRLKLFVGIGNVLHRDDGVGPFIASMIRESDYIRVLNAEVSIENYIGKINTINPDVLILIDSMAFNREPGYWQCMPLTLLHDTTTGTHHVSLGNLAVFFRAEIWVLGIQPADVSFGEGISPEVLGASKDIIDMINRQ
jgi:hydrogenase 3 maturation protease